jgi:hypothetical protein
LRTERVGDNNQHFPNQVTNQHCDGFDRLRVDGLESLFYLGNRDSRPRYRILRLAQGHQLEKLIVKKHFLRKVPLLPIEPLTNGIEYIPCCGLRREALKHLNEGFPGALNAHYGTGYAVRRLPVPTA